MSEKREFPILNGKLLSDLDLNGHKLLGLTLPEGGGGGSSVVPYLLVKKPLTERIELDNRAINEVTVDDSVAFITFVFPEKTEGYSRDFFLRLVITGETIPTLSFVEPNGGAVSFDVDDESWAEIEQGVNILMFTDTAE